MSFIYLPFLFQGAAMVFDEFYFHRKRGLPLWERIGHPLDSLTVFVFYAYLLLSESGSPQLKVILGLGAFSCLFITKDEFVHSAACEPAENWLHSILFILHPVSFFAAFLLWQEQQKYALLLQASLVFAFMIYQFVYWSLFAKNK